MYEMCVCLFVRVLTPRVYAHGIYQLIRCTNKKLCFLICLLIPRV